MRIDLLLLFGFGLSLMAHGQANGAPDSSWNTVFRDCYAYSGQPACTNGFNTWFWREDASGQHVFDLTLQAPGCTKATPCVRLKLAFQPNATAYTNAEMYNNSCVRQGPKYPQPQPFDRLDTNPWSKPLQHLIQSQCALPYPYRIVPGVLPPDENIKDGWNTTPGAVLEANPFAFTIFDRESTWQAVRDIAFNNPYLATAESPVRIGMTTRAQGKGGGSRGWGFWNTSLDPKVWQIAWFMEYSYQTGASTDNVSSTVLMQTVTADAAGNTSYCMSSLDPNDYDIYHWQNYRIEWFTSGIYYYVDDQLVAAHPNIAPKRAMAFHNWVDNRNYFGGTPSNFPIMIERSNDIRAFEVQQGSQTEPPEAPTGTAQFPAICGRLALSDGFVLHDFLSQLAKDYRFR